MTPVIEAYGITKRYGAITAVDHLNMQVNQGDVYGFIGRNGAGKSTVMRMIAGLARPTEGDIKLFGKPLGQSNTQNIGALIEAPGLYQNLNAFDNMMCKALAFGLADPKHKSAELLSFVGLGNVGKLKSKNFSMGMKQRLGLALALLGDPDLLLLDEPLNGLDPEGTRDIRQLIMQLNAERGMTVLVSSHVLEQLGKMATRYGVIRKGVMVREITAEQVDAECSDYLSLRTAEPNRTLAVLQERMGIVACQLMPDGIIRMSGADATVVGAGLSEAGIAVQELFVHQRDLEEFFVSMMGDERHV